MKEDVRESTPALRKRSRLHQLPVTVLSNSGRDQTPGVLRHLDAFVCRDRLQGEFALDDGTLHHLGRGH